MFKLSVQGTIINDFPSNIPLVSGTENFIEMAIEFSDEWEVLSREIIFSQGALNLIIPVPENNIIYFPKEINPGRVIISAAGREGGSITAMTNQIVLQVFGAKTISKLPYTYVRSINGTISHIRDNDNNFEYSSNGIQFKKLKADSSTTNTRGMLESQQSFNDAIWALVNTFSDAHMGGK